MCLASMCKSWKSLCDYFCSVSVSSPGCIWGLEISLHPFPLGHPFLLMPNFQKTKILASSPITSWEIGGETVETVSEFIFGGSKTTADGDCSHEIKRRLHLGRKVLTNLDSILKSRHYFANKGQSRQGYWFFQWSCMDVRVGLWRKLSAKQWMLLNCGVGEDSWESLGLQEDPTSPS